MSPPQDAAQAEAVVMGQRRITPFQESWQMGQLLSLSVATFVPSQTGLASADIQL